MAAKSIISRPVYGTLSPQLGRHHLFVADAEGARAISDMAAKAPAGFFTDAHIIYIAGSGSEANVVALEALGPAQFYQGPSFASALPRLKQTLTNAHMGLRVYLAGTEGLIGQAMQAALEAGIDHTSMLTEHRGSLARRMQCVHCKGITENVTTQPAACSHCGLLLLVRDHYSRRIAAFQGVCINAEDRSEIPPIEEAFP
ncbi:dimethylamine monooxygenase subunit DmmA family protein [Mesorhizobium sp. INR15]|uniref:dimethylamine monooxygenase subunit DmmA family protein n=1 Tax=Mesorhizobium sp. INR15 TaxID=2654248 RepID=UPI00189645F8|nr:dimethylamine monooxygenase subunit DmmA family protein [Mesorhizobium sp. INR15]QPC94261.1 hypothetical protein GA829_28765 [Mesorhizobium sp. INR15]